MILYEIMNTLLRAEELNWVLLCEKKKEDSRHTSDKHTHTRIRPAAAALNFTTCVKLELHTFHQESTDLWWLFGFVQLKIQLAHGLSVVVVLWFHRLRVRPSCWPSLEPAFIRKRVS